MKSRRVMPASRPRDAAGASFGSSVMFTPRSVRAAAPVRCGDERELLPAIRDRRSEPARRRVHLLDDSEETEIEVVETIGLVREVLVPQREVPAPAARRVVD